jgi:hypothetical protein
MGEVRSPRHPRDTGHQVWNKQRKDEVLIDVEDVALGHETKMRWNDTSAWVWSEQLVHEPLMSIETFETAQTKFDRTKRAATRVVQRRSSLPPRRHGAVWHVRPTDAGQWNHGQPYYRCKYPSDYPVDETRHPKSVYVRENAIVPGLDGWLASLFDEEHLDHTCEVLAGSDGFDTETEDRQAALGEQNRSCDERLERYRALLERRRSGRHRREADLPKSNESERPPRHSSVARCRAASSPTLRPEPSSKLFTT